MSSSMTGYQGMNGPSGGNVGMNGTGKMKAPPGFNMYQQYTPQQMQLHNQQYQYLDPNSFLSKIAGGDEAAFQQMEAPAYRQFQALSGQNASNFSNAGMGARHGSGFANAQDQFTSNFAQDLQSKRSDYMRNAMHDLMSFSNQLLNQSPYGLQEEQPSIWDSIKQGAGKGIGEAGAKGFMKNLPSALQQGFTGGTAGFAGGGPMGALAGGTGGFLKGILGY